MQGVKDKKSMAADLLKYEENKNFVVKTLADNIVKVQVEIVDDFCKIINRWKSRDKAYYTYRLKNERPYMVIISHLHKTIELSKIKAALTEEGYTVCNIDNIYH